jgi:hypothetical protein
MDDQYEICRPAIMIRPTMFLGSRRSRKERVQSHEQPERECLEKSMIKNPFISTAPALRPAQLGQAILCNRATPDAMHERLSKGMTVMELQEKK